MNSINIENNLKSLQLQYPPIFNKMDHEKYGNSRQNTLLGNV